MEDKEGLKNSFSNHTSSDIISKRKERLMRFVSKKNVWVIGVLIIAIILGVYIRSLPMQDHGGTPGLWDITTNTWTLGPDLDPWLFTRYAKIIVENGSLPAIDEMRNVPRGFDTSIETQILPYLIAYTYYFFNIFSDVNIEFAAVIFPVIMFGLTIISFFLFVREVFVRKHEKSKLNANIIALISTFFMIVIPAFLSRTIAGIPEKESAGFFFMFLAFYLFLRAWKSDKLKNYAIFSILAGIFTGIMGLIWGGVIYVYVTIAVATFIAFALNKLNKEKVLGFLSKDFIIYSLWLFFSIFLMLFFSNRNTLGAMLTSLSSGMAFLVAFIILIDLIIWNSSISKIKTLRESNIPQNIISLIIGLILLGILASIFFGPQFIIEKLKVIHKTIFKAIQGRWLTTVAENRQPYFTEWSQSFGPYVKNIPILFWMFFAGSVLLFKKMLNKIKEKDAWILTGLYVLFFFGLVFSRYAAHPHIMDGEGFISKFVYYGAVFLFVLGFLRYYLIYYKENHKGFEKINYEYIFLFSLFFLCLFTARGAVRLIMVLAPIAPIFVGFLIIDSIEKFKRTKDETFKMILGVLVILILIGSVFIFWTFYQSVKGQAYSFIPSHYNQQWQKAMEWVRNEVPEDAVFAHWWDYGYWVQSIGNRATVLDGGNAITYWNYLMGRYVLTGDNQKDALDYLYSHEATHLLIDSTDIGKYGAYSSIGSNAEYDRYSWMSPFVLDESQIQETSNQTIFLYPGGLALDEDLIIEEAGKEVLLPAMKTYVAGLILPMENLEDSSVFRQPTVVFIYQGIRHDVKMRYLSINGEQFMDFESGIDATMYVFPKLNTNGDRVSSQPLGASMFISPRLMRGMMSQIYILNDPLNNFPNFNLTHTQDSLVVESLNQQGMDLPEFIYYQGTQGPIKIWEIEYTGNEEVKQEYLDVDYTKYLDWVL